MALLVGIDEAGRGPVIGPMVMCGVLIDKKDEKKLVDLGVKDSKMLTPKKRESIAAQLKKIVKYDIVVVEPHEIDTAVESDLDNLNWLEAKICVKIIEKLKSDTVVLDCPSTNIKAYTEYIQKLIDKKIKLVCAHHADVDHPTVAAASIIAKVKRDELIAKIKKEIGVDFGSGYPSDPKTRNFLERNWDKFPGIFRRSWATYKKVLKDQAQSNLGEF